jgi:hypothetical protein
MARRDSVAVEPSPLIRTYRRYVSSELAGLRAARIKWGSDISVLDLSVGGVRFENSGELAAGSTVVLEFLGPSKTVLRTAQILRCENVRTIESEVRWIAGCEFRRPFPVSSFAGDTLPETAPATSDEARVWRQVVGKYRDGRLIRGYTNDFSPSNPYLHISPTPQADVSEFVSMVQLDALFFGRGVCDGFEEIDEPAGPDVVPVQGRKVAVPLPNGTEMIGAARSYSRSSSGFFVELDEQSGTPRVFVTAGGVRSIRFV